MVYIFIFFRALSLIFLGLGILAGIVHAIKYVYKHHDIDLISELVIIMLGVCMAVSWAVKLN
ncbi:hypothetical protein [Agathobacter sp.]|uniref:hypothetical protein n=1 Tax=Agathobacter sp. TaxID=2021311 RepID=UPI003AB53400